MAPAWLWCIIRHGGGGSWKENEKQIYVRLFSKFLLKLSDIQSFLYLILKQILRNPAITIQKEKSLFTQISINCAITFNLRHAGNDLSNKQQLCDIGLSRTSANRHSPSSVPPPPREIRFTARVTTPFQPGLLSVSPADSFWLSMHRVVLEVPHSTPLTRHLFHSLVTSSTAFRLTLSKSKS